MQTKEVIVLKVIQQIGVELYSIKEKNNDRIASYHEPNLSQRKNEALITDFSLEKNEKV